MNKSRTATRGCMPRWTNSMFACTHVCVGERGFEEVSEPLLHCVWVTLLLIQDWEKTAGARRGKRDMRCKKRAQEGLNHFKISNLVPVHTWCQHVGDRFASGQRLVMCLNGVKCSSLEDTLCSNQVVWEASVNVTFVLNASWRALNTQKKIVRDSWNDVWNPIRSAEEAFRNRVMSSYASRLDAS